MLKWHDKTIGTLLLFLVCVGCRANDITTQVFGNIREGIVAAFGDFNSDELTDVFIICDKMTTLKILYGEVEKEPSLKEGPSCKYNNHDIISIVPGDFDGDALMDVLVMLRPKGKEDTDIYKILVNWGDGDSLNCTHENEEPMLITKGEPLAIDYNSDMIIDLYGLDEEDRRFFWIFQNSRALPKKVQQPPPLDQTETKTSISLPNANAYLDLNNDNIADLFVQKDKHYEIWNGSIVEAAVGEKQHFIYNHSINFSIAGGKMIVGQAVFCDFELKGVQNIILPVCFQDNCSNSSILLLENLNNNDFRDLQVNFKDPQETVWTFVPPQKDDVYLKTITARSGDYNMDGYPDLIVTLKTISGPSRMQTFLLKNVPSKNKPNKRTFEVQWYALEPLGNNTVAGAFYDFFRDGVLDVILIEKKPNQEYRPLAFRNTLDYDANFVKVIVLTGLVNPKTPTQRTQLGRKRTYGTNLPGPLITYWTTTQDGDVQCGSSVQLPQSAYFALQLPYTIFGLGRTPNFVDTLTVALDGKNRAFKQLIPNSQIIVVPRPLADPPRWKAQLFVTPGKLILTSVIALGGTCLFIILIILVLYIKEKREDKQEKQQEPHRFHFDAM